MRYLIWSNEHCGWWKGNRHGYTTATHRAGLFGFEEARDIVTNANRYLFPHDTPNEFMVAAPNRVQIDNDLTDDLDWPIAERIGRVDAALAGQLGRSMETNARLRIRYGKLAVAALDFIEKVDRGEARSTQSYAAFKAALQDPAPSDPVA